MSSYKTVLLALIESKIDRSTITKDDNSTLAKTVVTYQQPSNILVRDFFAAQKCYVVFTLGRSRVEPGRHTLNVPKKYWDTFLVGIYTMDKYTEATQDATGEILRTKAAAALETMFESNTSTLTPYREHYLGPGEDNDRFVEGQMLYNTNFIVNYIIHG